jgi:hypothetical protein
MPTLEWLIDGTWISRFAIDLSKETCDIATQEVREEHPNANKILGPFDGDDPGFGLKR